MNDSEEPKGTYSKLYEMTRKSSRSAELAVDAPLAATSGRRNGRVRVVEPIVPDAARIPAVQPVQPPKMGRPPREIPRKQKTVYLTDTQIELLDDIHYQFKRRFKVEQSDLAGLAIELLGKVLELHHNQGKSCESLEALRNECMHVLDEVYESDEH